MVGRTVGVKCTVILIGLLAGCSGPPGVSRLQARDNSSVEYTLLDCQPKSDSEKSGLATGQTDFSRIWIEKCNSDELPEVDFQNQGVLYYLRGPKSHAGYRIEPMQLTVEGGTLHAALKRVEYDCGPEILSNPGLIMVVNTPAATLDLELVDEQRKC